MNNRNTNHVHDDLDFPEGRRKEELEEDNMSVDNDDSIQFLRPHVQSWSFTLSHQARIHNQINDFFRTKKYTDVNIICENRVFKCHRMLLAASSDYFDVMFSGSYKESRSNDIVLHDIDSETFESILAYIYRGSLSIDENNVYNVLRASDWLQLDFLKAECEHYLMERDIPAKEALKIFSLAVACRKKEDPLISYISQFILKHLEQFSKSHQFLDISFDDFSILLSQFRSASKNEEETLSRAICRWVAHSPSGSEEPKNRKPFVEKLTRESCFQYLSNESIKKTYDEIVTSGEQTSSSDREFIELKINRSDSALHVFTYLVDSENGEKTDNQLFRKSNLFTLHKSDVPTCSWDPSYVRLTGVCGLRTVAFGNQELYCLMNHERHDKIEQTFSVSSSVDLLSKHTLLQKPIKINRICGNTNIGIYASFHNQDKNKFLFLYNRDLNEWYPKTPPRSTSALSSIITCDEKRVYKIEEKQHNSKRSIYAYDPRVKQWERLSRTGDYGLFESDEYEYENEDECCSHKGKIYTSCLSASLNNQVDVFDIVAGKWYFTNLDGSLAGMHRFQSYDNYLWLIGPVLHHDKNTIMLAQKYDSFSQSWHSFHTSDRALMVNLFPDGVENEDLDFILDVTVFK